MKVYNQQKNILTPELQDLLQLFRAHRNFQVDEYIKAKIWAINEYFKQHQIHTAVVGISGGIDSAVVLALVNEAAKSANSSLKEIIPVLLPLTQSSGATNQNYATLRGQDLCKKLKLTPRTIDLSEVENVLRKDVEPVANIKGEPWAIGQLVSYLRTPTLYYITALCSQKGHRAVVCGTTNQDEGAYIGYFGKASDGLVDVQIISDIHKSEVFKVGEKLGVPQSILEVIPSGDMYDGRVDEEVFGTTYNFVELYMNYLRLNPVIQKNILQTLDNDSILQFNQGQENLEKMHKYNGHKYIGASPAVHLDVLSGNVPGGWKNNKTVEFYKSQPAKIVNPLELSNELVLKMFKNYPQAACNESLAGVYNITKLLTAKECENLVNFLQNKTWVPTGKDGYTKSFNYSEIPGSYRISTFNQDLADLLWYRIQEFLPAVRNMNDTDKTDFNSCKVWYPVGVSPVFRFIKYEKGGLLIPHYDAPYVYDDQKKTLMSLVIYLTSNKEGATRIIADDQDRLKFEDRNFNDWTKPALDNQVIQTIAPIAGNGLMFDHRVLHDSDSVNNETKIIIRTDIIFVKGGV